MGAETDVSRVGEGAKAWDRLIGAAPTPIHIKNNMRGKHPTEEGFIEAPLD
jgi:hypothetical protein